MNLRGELKLADFGLSRLIPDRAYDQQDGMTNKVCTLWYRAPELLLGSRDYGLAIDIWAAGCIFAEFFIRQPLFKSEYNDDAGGQIEQLHKVALLCGAPSEDVWEGARRPHRFASAAHSLLIERRFAAARPQQILL